MLGQGDVAFAKVGVSLTHTGMRTGEVTEVFVIMLGTLTPAIADVCGMQTNSRASTAVEIATGWRFALVLVLAMRAVVYTIAEHKERQAVAIP